MTIQIRNPRTGELDFNLPVFGEHDVAEVASVVRNNQLNWAEQSIDNRCSVLLEFADAIECNKQAVIDAVTADTGRLGESILEVDVTINAIRRWCKQAPVELRPEDSRAGEIPFLNIKQGYLPYSVVGVISPWNFPLLLSLTDAIPALLAGCSVVIKPSEVTSRFVSPLVEILQQVPALHQVLKFVTGDGATGAALINVADTICFTGSVKTGRKVAQAAATRFIPAFLELGGKDPAIVCEDADLDSATSALCWGSMVNAGQSCMSLERVYVHKNIAQDFKDKLVKKVSALTHNFPVISEGHIGPIIAQQQVDIVKSQLADARHKGATILCGGNVVNLGGGEYCQPTLLTDVTLEMTVLSEESFAAILPIVEVESDEEAVRLANQSDYGLSAAVFSQNAEKATRIANQLEAGAVSINDASLTALVHEAEKQSFKLSGLGGSRMGSASIWRFVRKKAYLTNTGVADPWWFN